MDGASRWISWKTALVLLPLVALAAAKAGGLATVGLVTTGSMEPGLPPGSLVLALPGHAEIGDVVVFQAGDGGQVVHRVVDVQPGGLVTQGDANERTDQASGMAPIDQDRAHPVPTIAGSPAAIVGTWLKPLGLVFAQMALLTVGLKGLFDAEERRGLPWPLRHVQPTTLLWAAGALLLVTAPSLSETVEADRPLQVQGLPVPTLVRIDSGGTVSHETLGPLATQSVEADGSTEIVRVPALPGARTLSAHGAVWGMLPTALTVWAAAAALRLGAT